MCLEGIVVPHGEDLSGRDIGVFGGLEAELDGKALLAAFEKLVVSQLEKCCA